MKYIETAQLSHFKSLNKTLTRYSAWIIAVGLGLALIGAVLVIPPKLQNPQVEPAQPVGSFVFAGDLATLPHFGQTFVPRQAGLRGIYLPLRVIGSAGQDAALRLHVRLAPESGSDIRSVTLPLTELAGQNLARFLFEPLPDSFNTRYYFWLEPLPGSGKSQIELKYGGPNAYLDGALYIDDKPQDFQASFFLAYDRRLIGYDWAGWLAGHASTFVILVLLLILPGGALLSLLKPNYELDWLAWLIFSMGLSLAFFPLLLLWGTLIGIKFDPVFVWSLLGIAAGIIGWQTFQKYRGQRPHLADLLNFNFKDSNFQLNFVLAGLICLLFFTRFVPVRGIEVPMWQDSYHHTVISSLIAEQGKLINSWEPYAPLKTFTAQYGFHTAVAFLHWASGLKVTSAVIVMGQFLNVMAVLALYPLTVYIGGGKWGGVGAMAVAGFVTTTPIVYTNWGRYPQLASQVLIPLAIYASLVVLEKSESKNRLFLIAGLLIAGMSLTYYRTAFNFLVFVLIYVGLKAFWSKNDLKNWSLKFVKGLSLLTIITLGLMFPWIIQVFEGQLPLFLMQLASQQVKQPPTLVQSEREDWLELSQFIPLFMLAGSLLTWGLGLFRRWFLVILLGLWALTLTLPSVLGLPAAGMVFPGFGTRIFIYVPISLLLGYLFGKVVYSKYGPDSTISKSILGVAVSVLLLWGSLTQLSLIDLSGRLVTQPDLAAIAWIKENISPDAKFLVNDKITSDAWVTGTDAGLWLPILTKRDTTVPPEYYVNEVSTDPNYPADVLNLSRQIEKSSVNSAAVVELLKSAGVTHVYIGQLQGLTSYSPKALLDPQQLANSPFYQLLYHQEHVWIFVLKTS